MVCIKSTIAFATILSVSHAVSRKSETDLGSIKSAEESDSSDYVSNNCVGKEDGTYWLKFSDSDSDFTVVQQQCSNEYIILDPSKDDNLQNYFSSFDMWHYAVAGPKNGDPVNWQEWFLGDLLISNNDDDDDDDDDDNDGDNSDEASANCSYYDNELASYLVSPGCDVCDESSDRQLNSDKSSYWMTGLLAKLYWKFFGLPECDMNYETYECFSCLGCQDPTLACDHISLSTANSSEEWDYSGICSTAILSSEKQVAKSRKLSNGGPYGWVYKPSIGTNGKFCTCFKPSENDYKQFKLTDKDKEIIQTKQKTVDDQDGEEETAAETETETEEVYIYLSQTDFDLGPYRIRKSGTYVISEDIVFNFGENNDYKYFPSKEEDTDDLYPGSGEYRGPYHMGYFAGITVECDDVTIDLNGFSLSQSYETYFAQRFFSIIELSSQQFLPGVGPAFFGHNPARITNIVIKNGILGRSSHFGIHGNFPTNIKIENIHIRDFATHGVHLDGWTNLEMTNVEVGPSSTIEYIRGDYAHARLVLPRLKAILSDLEEEGTAETKLIQFANRDAVKLEDLIDVLEFEMDLAFDYALNRVYDTNSHNDYISPDLLPHAKESKYWQSAKKQFAWENGLPCATSLHGIFLNQWSASTQTFTLSTSNPSKNGKLTNIKIHDLKHSFYELFMFMRTTSTKLYGNETDNEGVESTTSALPVLDLIPWNIPIDAYAVFGFDKERVYDYWTTILNFYQNGIDDESYKNYDYIGSSLSDSILALTYFSDDWGYLGLETITDSFLGWVQGENYITRFQFACNKDIMHHAGKGLLGLRIDGSENIELNNIYVYNLYQETPLGSTFCGEYSMAGEDLHGMGGGAHLRQVSPMQIGFSGNNLNGISIVGSKHIQFSGEIYVYNLNNKYGEGHGISIWPNTEIILLSDTNVIVSDLNMGTGLTQDDINSYNLSWTSRPNRIPESCAIRVENKDKDTSGTLEESSITNEDNGENIQLLSCNINGYVACLGDEDLGYSMYGDYETDNDLCINQYFSVSEHLTSHDLSSINNDNNNNNVAVDVKQYDSYNLDYNISLVACFLVIGVVIYTKCCKNDKLKLNNGGYGALSTVNRNV